MTPEAIMAIVGATLFGALISGAGLYLKLGRTVLTRVEHREECTRTIREPLTKNIAEIKEMCQDNTRVLQDIRVELARMNGTSD